MRLRDQTAIVTGASQGIGLAISEAFAREGASVTMVARSAPRLDEAVSSVAALGSAVPCLADVSSEADVARVFETVLTASGRVDILVNNAGIAGPTAPIEDVGLAEWQECLDTNLTGVWLCCREAARHMKPQGSGRIINIGSISGKRPLPERTPYCATKMGLVGLTRTLAAELGPHDVNVNCVSPGAVNTARLALLAERASMSLEELLGRVSQGAALRRVTEPDEVADLCVFLASAAARNITGQDVTVDAGTHMG
ncbi:MAG: SDR family oxidoreductase [Actinomycetia bacterium]|nr:SDR family oxidoreductase [Actinomycetes bacterium]